MNDQDFANLVESIKQAGQIKRGELQPSRTFEYGALDIKAIRQKFHQSQREFALMIGVSISTLQNWEQGKRKPTGPAKALLKVAAQNPEIVSQVLATN